ncbi:MAG TPA: YdeI/OmpD-associated family protein [Candidatus Gracilibacteria bacterium]|nr:YdeI/OmpD-associated family protein [Candidatus Gracilibacteria bacterium]
MPSISFKTQLITINDWTLMVLPKSASSKLPSRGLVLVQGTINGKEFKHPLEPDGKGSHWLQIDSKMLKTIGAKSGDTVELSIESSKEWEEPNIPKDIKDALEADKKGMELWLDCTTKAHWEWIRWIRSTKNPDTRKIRIEKTISKLKSGKRAPCCFNMSMCTEPHVSKGGVLLDS